MMTIEAAMAVVVYGSSRWVWEARVVVVAMAVVSAEEALVAVASAVAEVVRAGSQYVVRT
jgi:hypothetical protein